MPLPLQIPMLPACMHVYKTVAGTEFQRVFPCHEVEIGLWPVLTRDDKEVQVRAEYQESRSCLASLPRCFR